MSKIIHAVAHLLGLNRGRVVSATDEEGNIWIAFECSACGKISGAFISRPITEQESNDGK